jgi:hypothetical protein
LKLTEGEIIVFASPGDPVIADPPPIELLLEDSNEVRRIGEGM